ncbi:MAG: hypothetical protein AAGF32_08380, partial [Pseudomonadota bacterium]
VLDEQGDFAERCNMAMVDLEPVEAESDCLARAGDMAGELESHGLVDVLANMDSDDEQRLQTLITNHARYTGSERAAHILENWDEYRTKFVKVMPVEYRRALKEMATAQAADETGFGVLEIGVAHMRKPAAE